MAALGSLVVELSANVAKFESAMNRAQYVARQSMGEVAKAVERVPISLAKLYAAFRGAEFIGRGFEKAISTVDDFQVSIIGIAASLTNMAKPGQGDFAELFSRNKNAAIDMYKSITLEAAKHFATANEMMTVYNKMVQSGYAARMDEVEALGILTDVIKLKTKGQDVERQLNTEIMALMEGQARSGSLLAQELKQRLGPEWGAIVEKHKQAGDLVQWIASLYPGISAANKDIEGTINAQWATFKSLLELIAIDGLLGVYQSIAGTIKDTNDYLRENERIIADKLIAGWITVKYYTGIIKDDLQWMIDNAGKISGAQYAGTAEATSPDQRTFPQQTALNFSEAFWSTPADLIIKISDGLTTAYEYAIKINNALTSWIVLPIVEFFEKQWQQLKNMENIVSTPIDWLITSIGLDKIWDKVQELIGIISKPLTWAINLAFNTPKVAEEPIKNKNLTIPDKSLAAQIKQAQMASQSLYEMQVPGIGLTTVKVVDFAPPAVENRSPQGKESKGGKSGAGAAADRMLSIIDNLNKEIAKLSQGSIAEIDAWATKAIDDIDKVGKKGAETQEALGLVEQARTLKVQKVNDDYQKWWAGAINDRIAGAQLESQELIKKYQGVANSREQIESYTAKKIALIQNEQDTERLNLAKGYLDQFSQLLPGLSEQMRYKRMALDIEKQQADLQLNRLYLDTKITAEVLDQSRAAQAFVNQLKEYQLRQQQLSTGGVGAGLTLWGNQRNDESQTATTQAVINFMKDAETEISGALSSAMINTMKGVKTNWEDFFSSVAESGIKKGMDYITGKLFNSLAQLLGDTALNLVNPLVYGSTQASSVLEVGGYNAGAGIINAAITASNILSGSSSGSGISNMLGGFAKIAGNLFGISTGSIGAPSYTPTAETSWGNAAYSNFLQTRHSGGMLYAHSGMILPDLRSDEVPFIGLTGERVLNRQETADYNSGRTGASVNISSGGGYGGFLSNLFVSQSSSGGLATNEMGAGYDVTTELANIPWLASGGIVTGPTLAMIGEGGNREAVIPLDRFSPRSSQPAVNITINNNAKNTEATAQQEANGDITVTINQLMAQEATRGPFAKVLKTHYGLGTQPTRR